MAVPYQVWPSPTTFPTSPASVPPIDTRGPYCTIVHKRREDFVSDIVIDSSALLAVIFGEPERERVSGQKESDTEIGA